MPANTIIKLAHAPVSNEIRLEYNGLHKAVLILRSVNHKLRQQIIKLLEENERMNVTQLHKQMRLEQSVVSQHLAILRRAGIVHPLRDGKKVIYILKKERLQEIGEMIYSISDE